MFSPFPVGKSKKSPVDLPPLWNRMYFVLDEPSSNLDAYSIADFRKLLKILKSQGKTIIIAEHRLYYLYDLADRIIYLATGKYKGIILCRNFS